MVVLLVYSFRVSLDDIECISHKEWEDIGIGWFEYCFVRCSCLKYISIFLKGVSASQFSQFLIECQCFHNSL